MSIMVKGYDFLNVTSETIWQISKFPEKRSLVHENIVYIVNIIIERLFKLWLSKHPFSLRFFNKKILEKL